MIIQCIDIDIEIQTHRTHIEEKEKDIKKAR